MKVLICESPEYYGHGLGCRDRILDECPSLHWTEELTDETTCYIFLGNMYDAFDFAIEHGFDLINYSYAWNSNSFNRQFESLMLEHNIWIVRGHAQNRHLYSEVIPSMDYVVSVGAGDSIGNKFSYGPGLEFYVQETCESWSTARVTGILAQLLIDHPDWSVWHARAALRQTASNYASGQGWTIEEIDANHDKGGFGELHPDLATQVTQFEIFGPLSIQASWNPPLLKIRSNPWPGPGAQKTVCWKSATLPIRDATPDAANILHEGQSFSERIFYDGDDSPFICFQTAGSYSNLESNEVKQVDCFLNGNEVWYQKPAPEKSFQGQYLTYVPFFELCKGKLQDLSGLCTDPHIDVLNANHAPQLTPRRFDNSLELFGDSFQILADATELRTFWPRTYSFWFRLSTNQKVTLLDHGDETHLALSWDPDDGSFKVQLYPNTYNVFYPEELPVMGQWNFVCLILPTLYPYYWDIVRMWLNNYRLEDPMYESDYIDEPLGRLSIGGSATPNPGQFDISDFRIFAAELSHDHCRNLYEHGKWRIES